MLDAGMFASALLVLISGILLLIFGELYSFRRTLAEKVENIEDKINDIARLEAYLHPNEARLFNLGVDNG